MTVMTKEQRVAVLLEKLEGYLGENGEFKNHKEMLTALQADIAVLKKLDTAKVLEELDKFKAGQEVMIRQIRNSKKGLYVSGIEDQPFSVLKAMVAVRTNDWSEAGHEQEMMKSWREKAGQNVGNSTAGSYFIADQVIPEVITALYTRSVFVALNGESGETRVSVLEGLVGGNVKIPKFNGGLIAYWIGEEDEYAESQTGVGDVTMNPKKMGILVRITDSMKKFQSFGFETLLRKDLERAAAKKLDWTVLYGNGGDNAPRGILNSKNLQVYSAQSGTVVGLDTLATAQADWAGAELNFDGLENMGLALEEQDVELDESFAIISAKRYFNRLKQLKIENYSGQTSGQPYLLGIPMLSEQKLKELIGYDIGKSNQVLTSQLPGESVGAPTTSTTEKFGDVVAGNMREIVVGRWAGVEIEDDSGKGKGFTSDATYMKLRLYADIGMRQDKAVIACPDARVRA